MKLEHEIQKSIVQVMHMNGYMSICTDVFCGLRFIGNNQPKRLSFIGQIKALGGTVGTPDLIFLKKNEILFVEMKTETGKLSKEQKDIMALLTKWGFNVQVWRGLDDCLAYLEWTYSVNHDRGNSSKATSVHTNNL